MAPQQPSSPEQHQAGQDAIATALGASLAANVWPEFDPTAIQSSLPRFTALVTALITKYGQASGALAVSQYRAQRTAAGIPGRPTIPLAPPPSLDEVGKQLDWATSGLYGQVTPESLQATQTKVVGVAERLALDVGRQTTIDAVRADPKARAWARVTEPGACSFCLLLATRGAVYKTETSGDFRSHDHCRCTAEPVFGEYEPTAAVRAAQLLYKDTPYGKNAAAARNNFRQALARERAAGNSRFI